MITEDWKIKKLEDHFASITLPSTIALSECELIINPKLCISTHISILKKNDGNKTFIPYLLRINRIKDVLERVVEKPKRTKVKKANKDEQASLL